MTRHAQGQAQNILNIFIHDRQQCCMADHPDQRGMCRKKPAFGREENNYQNVITARENGSGGLVIVIAKDCT